MIGEPLTWPPALTSIATAVGIGIGGLWAAWHAFKIRPLRPRGKLTASVTIENPHGRRPQIVVVARVENIGIRRFTIDRSSDPRYPLKVEISTISLIRALLATSGSVASSTERSAELFANDGQQLELGPGESTADCVTFVDQAEDLGSVTARATVYIRGGALNTPRKLTDVDFAVSQSVAS